jgi:DNA-directed RNA polymerase sigma subunit (sigma70/sigma32)
VGAEFGVTRERIRQIEAKVHEKIRNHNKAERLKNY